MELKQLRCFLAVADASNFGRAARTLNMLPSALGRQVRLLEEELGTPLFHRTTRQVTLAPAGAALLPEARAILDRAAGAACLIRALSADGAPLRIGAIDSAAAGLLPEPLARLHATHPEIVTRLVEAKSAQILPWLRSGRLDLGFVRPPHQADGLECQWLMQERPVVVLPQRHPLAKRQRLQLNDLAGLPVILPPRAARPHSRAVVLRLYDLLGETPRVAQEAEEKQTIINLVAAGIGMAVLPEWAARMRVPGVSFRGLDLPLGTALPEWSLVAAWRSGSPSLARDVFLGLLQEFLASRAPERTCTD
ncbi:LysR family transcriptional regulator [Teichococcus vastitatis]|uniref:LysR family transcriptional regulator n=1 Tax=Teichococcus vastitatis TaxID=2307076 RepID=A0ABS9W0T0_9PROT|nr:LysR family transcriptional regulator [Pseudoroseomonas vastitatis]MCI0752914.1 LysR family transcriptional regulator [Pseudoroseomonas vastitatis]